MREPCGREALQGCARFVAKKFSAVRSKVHPATVCTIRMRVAAVSFIPCTRTASGVCGPEPSRACGSGRPVLRAATPRRSFARPAGLWLQGTVGRVWLPSPARVTASCCRPPAMGWRRTRYRASRNCSEQRVCCGIVSVLSGLERCSTGSCAFKTADSRWPQEKSRLSGAFISALLEDREGTIWAGTTNGLDRFRQAAVSTISANEGLSTPVACVLAARDGSLWMGSYGGLNRWHGGRLTIYRATAPPVGRSVPAKEPLH